LRREVKESSEYIEEKEMNEKKLKIMLKEKDNEVNTEKDELNK
jgi:hypothetical protein